MKKDREALTKEIENLTNKNENVEAELKEELRNAKTKIG